MVSAKIVEDQLKQIGFKVYGWGRGEVKELPGVMLPDEEIYECVNGIYEGGFALLIATDVRVLLVDKKPLNYLTVEDMRFDMINEIDYSHRLFGAYISISAGEKNLKFRSYNQPRLRKLVGHVQHCMAEVKRAQSSHQQSQNKHLEEINQQLQVYLLAQHEQQQKLHNQLEKFQATNSPPNAAPAAGSAPPAQPDNRLNDYLYAQSLLAQYRLQNGQNPEPAAAAPAVSSPVDLYADGMKEIYGPRYAPEAAPPTSSPQVSMTTSAQQLPAVAPPPNEDELNLLRIAYSKLPTVLRSRKFGTSALKALKMLKPPKALDPAGRKAT